MHEPYRMVFVSIISSVILAIGLLVYKFIYPKKNINYFPLLLLIALLPLISILRPGSYESGDLSEHAKIAMTFYRSLEHGNIIPQWTDLACGVYGCPVFIFIYILPYYIISLFHFIGLSFIESAKLLLALSFVTSGMTMYVWIKNEFGAKAGFIAGLFYLYAPYHLVDLHFRNAIGEMLAFALLPLCFYFTKKLIITPKKKWLIFNSITLTALLLSHVVATAVTVPFMIIYAFFLLKRKKVKKNVAVRYFVASCILFILLSCFYWLPILVEGKYIQYGATGTISFSTFSDLIYSPWRYGLLFQGPEGKLSHLIGYSQILLIIFGIYLYVKKEFTDKYERTILGLFILSSLICIFMILPLSQPFWETVPLIKSFQFSYRLLMFIALGVAVIAAIVLRNVNNKIVFIICLFTILVTILNWGNRKNVPEINDNVLYKQILYKDQVKPLTAPVWVKDRDVYKKTNTSNNELAVLSGDADIVKTQDAYNNYEYVVNAKNDVVLKKNTFYYPGWKAYVNNKEVMIDKSNKDYPGTIVFTVKKGLYKISIVFTDTFDRALGKIISLTTVLMGCAYFLFHKRK